MKTKEKKDKKNVKIKFKNKKIITFLILEWSKS
jgi:hypothetical protein